MFDRIKRMFSVRRDLGAVAGLNSHELADMGVSRATLDHLVRMPAHIPARMAKMAGLLGARISDVERDRNTYLASLDRCETCASGLACAKLLGGKELDAAAAADARHICPNAPVFKSFARECA